MPGENAHDTVPRREMITACAIGSTVVQLLDQTIANVALPYTHGSFSAIFDESIRILTLYDRVGGDGPLAELDINPLMVLPEGLGVKAVDALVVFRSRWHRAWRTSP